MIIEIIIAAAVILLIIRILLPTIKSVMMRDMHNDLLRLFVDEPRDDDPNPIRLTREIFDLNFPDGKCGDYFIEWISVQGETPVLYVTDVLNKTYEYEVVYINQLQNILRVICGGEFQIQY